MINEIVGFEHLHRHSDYSLLDGFAMVKEYAKRSKEVNQRFLCITDHGMMGAIPQQIAACEKHSIKPIFGCELYMNPMQPDMQGITDDAREELKKLRKSYHLTAIAVTNEGYKNLVQLTSWAWLHGFYYRPRVNYEKLLLHKEGLIVGSGCYNCEIGQTFDKLGEDAAMDMVERYKNMFGDKFFLEVMLLDFSKQKPYNAFILRAHDKFGIPLIVTNDCHYCSKEDSEYQRKMLMIGTQSTVADIQQAIAEGKTDELFELQDANLWMKSEEELNEKWEKDYSDIFDYDLFKQAKMNTVKICEMVDVQLDCTNKLPDIDDGNGVLKKESINGFYRRALPKTKDYLDRIKEEVALITDKGFSSYFLIEKEMTDEARRWWAEQSGGDGSEAVGPGRGSGAGSLVNYCLGITDVDPMPHGLLFSRFLSPARGGLQMKTRFTDDPIPSSVPPKEVEEAPF